MVNIYKTSILYLFSELSIKAASFLLLPLYTRLITPAEYGNIYLLITISNFLTVLFSITIQSSISRFYFDCRTNDDIINMFSSIIKFILLFSSTLYLITILFGNKIFSFLEIEFYPYVILAIIASYFSIFYNMIAALLQVSQKAKQLSLITIISSIISLLIMVVLVINIKDKIFAYMFSFFLGSIVNFIIFMLYSYKYFSIKAKDKKIFKYIKYSGVRLPVDLSAWIVTFADRLMLYDLKGESESGIYSIGYKIGSGIEVITNAINKAYVPFAFNQLKKDSDLNNLSSKVLNFYTLYFFITFTIIMFSKEIVALLAPSYKESLGVIVIILFSYLINGLKSLFQVPMDFKIEFVKIKSILWLTSAFVNVFLNLLFIPKYSYTGAAVATFFSYLIIFLPILYFSDKATKVKYPIKEMLVVLFLSLSILPFFMLNLSIFNFLIKLLVLMIYYILLSKVINKNLIGILRMLK